MRNFYRLNSLYEYEENGIQVPKNIKLKSHFLEYLFLIISSPGDLIYFSETANKEILEIWKKKGIQTGEITYHPEVPQGFKEIFWGKKEYINLNSKFFQNDLKNRAKISDIFTKIIYNEKELYNIDLKNKNYVAKPEFGFSGRGYRFLHKEDHNGFPFLLEEWMERSKDFSALFDVTENKCKFLTLTRMNNSIHGKYLETRLAEDNKISEELQINLEQILNQINLNYTGPVSVDGFDYIFKNEIHRRPVSEINFRFSMGRICYELSKKLRTGSGSEIKSIRANNDTSSLIELLDSYQKLYPDQFTLPLTPLFLGKIQAREVILFAHENGLPKIE